MRRGASRACPSRPTPASWDLPPLHAPAPFAPIVPRRRRPRYFTEPARRFGRSAVEANAVARAADKRSVRGNSRSYAPTQDVVVPLPPQGVVDPTREFHRVRPLTRSCARRQRSHPLPEARNARLEHHRRASASAGGLPVAQPAPRKGDHHDRRRAEADHEVREAVGHGWHGEKVVRGSDARVERPVRQDRE